MRVWLCLFCLVSVCAAQAQFACIEQTVENDFGEYVPHRSEIYPDVPAYQIEPGLRNIQNRHQFRLDPADEATLEARGFVAVPSHFQQMYLLYQHLQEQNIPLFVTTDAVLHAYHILYDYTLRLLEIDAFVADLEMLTGEMLQVAEAQFEMASTPLARQAATKNAAFFGVAAQLLGIPQATTLPQAQEMIGQELTLIQQHQGMLESPIFGYVEDYTQYIPRGHYTRNASLERFFRAMMWYGRMGFRLAIDDVEKAREETLQALLITASMQPASLMALWNRIYEPTVFFVGKADDLTLGQYRDVARQVYGATFASLAPDALAAQIDGFIEAAKQLPPPEINSSVIWDSEDFQQVTKGFRFMGQRFIPDSYILFQLVHKRVSGRFFPRGLDVMAVFGSQRAYQILTDMYGEKRYVQYQPQLSKLQAEFADLGEDAWAQNLYWNWLYALMPLLTPKDTGYPTFMQHGAWADKELATALGSWTELRHDTILYAKQGYTELTAMPEAPQMTRGYVEPNPELYARLASLARMMISGLQARGLAFPPFTERLERLEDLLLELKVISEAELAGQPLTEDQSRTIWEIGDTLEYLNSFPSDIAGRIEGDEDQDMAVVADVHTDPNSGQVLEEGVGHPMRLYVVVPDGDTLTLVQGGMFSYYEFRHPMSDRLTDAKWQERVQTGAVKLPGWMDSFVAQGAFENPPAQGNTSPRWDINGDGIVDVLDMVDVALGFGNATRTRHAWLDMNDDGVVDVLDIVAIGQHFGERFQAAPVALDVRDTPNAAIHLTLRNEAGQTWVELRVPPEWDVRGLQFDATFDAEAPLRNILAHEDAVCIPPTISSEQLRHAAFISIRNGSLAEAGILARLIFDAPPRKLALHDLRLVDADRQVLEVPTLSLPDASREGAEFQLMPNYPNPFNPETWIPYQLPEALHVTLHIYNSNGQLVRFMDLGPQPAGHHLTREDAIRWDGRNDAGERIASGTYVYRLRAGNYEAERKMLVVK